MNYAVKPPIWRDALFQGKGKGREFGFRPRKNTFVTLRTAHFSERLMRGIIPRSAWARDKKSRESKKLTGEAVSGRIVPFWKSRGNDISEPGC
jgi:hypothetical protein